MSTYTVQPSYPGSKAWVVMRNGKLYTGVYYSEREAKAAAKRLTNADPKE